MIYEFEGPAPASNSFTRLRTYFQHLDLSSSPTEDSCCDPISRFESLTALFLNHTKVSVKGVGKILSELRTLTTFECDAKIQRFMTSAASRNSIPSYNKLGLRSISLIGADGLDRVIAKCPEVAKVRVGYSEFGTDVDELDEGLLGLRSFPSAENGNLQVTLDLSNFNLLYLVQVMQEDTCFRLNNC